MAVTTVTTATTATDELRYIKCPTCDTKVEEQNLARLGLTKEELAILRVHRKDETFGKFLQLVDLFMKRMDPEKLVTESEMKRAVTQLQKTIEGVQAALTGTAIGKVGELVTVKELKSAFPQDNFSDENANKGDTDIIATIIENGNEQAKVAISCKYVEKWSASFIQQLKKNMKQEKTEYGLLVTKSFPSEALNDRVYNLEKIMMVKPEFLSVAYGGYRREVMALEVSNKNIKNQKQNEKEFNKTLKVLTNWLNDRTNPILKCIEACKKLSSEKKSNMKKLVKYIEKVENTMSDLEEDTTDQLELIDQAMKNLAKVLKTKEDGI